jgi:hypothetical protein
MALGHGITTFRSGIETGAARGRGCGEIDTTVAAMINTRSDCTGPNNAGLVSIDHERHHSLWRRRPPSSSAEGIAPALGSVA